MRISDFTYDLPEELIAQVPLPDRTASRLLCLDGSELRARSFRDLVDLLHAKDLLVFNDTRVIPARLFGRKATGGKVEIFLERSLDHKHFLALVRSSKPLRENVEIVVSEGITVRSLGRTGAFYEMEICGSLSTQDLFDRYGKLPLPPYIRREPDPRDSDRYQTVYARSSGAVAAPTAGLHFDRALLEELRRREIEIGYVTLHVGAGTFQPIRTDTVEAHRMHSERYELSPQLAEQVRAARDANARVIAVGTTVVRVLESAASGGGLVHPVQGSTNIFIYPGYRFQVVDALVTNFHLPGSTLLLLVCAFGGQARVLNAYRYAVSEKFRFFSYGDAMWVTQDAV